MATVAFNEKHLDYRNYLPGVWGCVKSFLLALRAKLYLDGGAFFQILRSKIWKKAPPSKEYFAAAGGKILIIQPQILFPKACPAK